MNARRRKGDFRPDVINMVGKLTSLDFIVLITLNTKS